MADPTYRNRRHRRIAVQLQWRRSKAQLRPKASLQVSRRIESNERLDERRTFFRFLRPRAVADEGGLDQSGFRFPTTTTTIPHLSSPASMSNLRTIETGPSTAAPSDGSRTQTIQDSQPRDENASNPSNGQSSGVLRLRGGPRSRPAVVWREDVIDNEDMGKKSSKSASLYYPCHA